VRPFPRSLLAFAVVLAGSACHKHAPAGHDTSNGAKHAKNGTNPGEAKDAGEAPGPVVVNPTDRSPPKRPPPLRAPHPRAPALPDLPELSKQERPEEAPRDANLNDEPCRAVWTGSAKASLSCAKALAFGDKEEAGARLLVPRKLLSRSPDKLPRVVDHRRDHTEGPIRNQGTVPACTAFAEAAALDHALSRWSGRPSDVSVMQIWSRYHSPSEESSLAANVTHPIGAEKEWPFDVAEANRWVPCDMAPRSDHRKDCGKKVDEQKEKHVEEKAIGEFTEVEYLGKPDVTVLEAKIAAGQDIIVALEVPSSFVPKGKRGARYIPNYGKSSGADSGHAFVLAGYANYPHGAYFLVHNSWGPKWGDDGYAWMHMATLSKWAKQFVAIDAEPLEREAGKRPRRVRGTASCANGLVPDSIGGKCSEACPDHSPRHDDVCAITGQCPKDYVNLTGECVLAAPERAGRDAETGIAWTCGPGGCSYTIPKASDPGCHGESCAMSCPAPDFHVAKIGKTLVCVE
jgi:C1A family cysteine protease